MTGADVQLALEIQRVAWVHDEPALVVFSITIPAVITTLLLFGSTAIIRSYQAWPLVKSAFVLIPWSHHVASVNVVQLLPLLSERNILLTPSVKLSCVMA